MTGSEGDPRATIDHETVRQWVERRGGEPAAVPADASAAAGRLCILFPDDDRAGPADERAEPIDWESFFERFEDRELALVYREEVDSAEPTSDGGDGPDRWYEFADRVFVGEV